LTNPTGVLRCLMLELQSIHLDCGGKVVRRDDYDICLSCHARGGFRITVSPTPGKRTHRKNLLGHSPKPPEVKVIETA
jgi:hypothetical protein